MKRPLTGIQVNFDLRGELNNCTFIRRGHPRSYRLQHRQARARQLVDLADAMIGETSRMPSINLDGSPAGLHVYYGRKG